MVIALKCGDWENCLAYDPDVEECETTNGCMTAKGDSDEY